MEEFITIFIFVVISTSIIFFVICRYIDKLNNESEKEVVLYNPFYVRHIAGLDINYETLCTISFTNKKILIKQVKGNNVLRVFSINNNKVKCLEEDTIVEKRLISGDSIGNAILGGLMFGGIGAIVGATSGTSIKDVKCDIDVLKIKYISDNEEKCILFSSEDTFNYKGFIKSYNKNVLGLKYREIENIDL